MICFDDCRKIPAYENLGSAPALVPTSALKLLFKRHLVPSSKALSHSSHSTNEDHSDVDVPARAETAERPKEAITLPRHPQLDSFVKQLSKLRKSESKIKKKRGGVGGRSSSKKCPAAAVVSILLQCATDGTLDQLVQSLVVEEKNAPENGGSTAAASSAGSSMPQEKRARIVDDSKKSKKQKRKLLPISWIESDTLANMCETFFSMGSGDSAASTTGVSVSSRGEECKMMCFSANECSYIPSQGLFVACQILERSLAFLCYLSSRNYGNPW